MYSFYHFTKAEALSIIVPKIKSENYLPYLLKCLQKKQTLINYDLQV